MVVHFPLAFLMASSLFILLYLLFRNPSLEITSFYLLILGAIATPFAIATGTLTWWVNYQLKQNRLIRRKIELSAVLLGMEVALILWRGLNPGVFAQQMNPIYFILMLILTPVVGLIGSYGGQLTFPEKAS